MMLSNYVSGAINVYQVRDRLIDLLKIPITSISISSFSCELFLNQNRIGSLPLSYYRDAIRYDTSGEHLQNLDWARIYSLQKSIIAVRIKERVTLKSVRIIPVSFRRLFVENEFEELIASFQCKFENNHWTVIDEQIISPVVVLPLGESW